MSRLIDVYNARAVKQKSKIKIKRLGTIQLKEGVQLKDKMIKRIMIDDYIFCHFFTPTITHEYLCGSNKVPVIYGRVDYIKKLIRRPLMSIFLFFVADEKEFKKRKKVSGGKPYNGKFKLEFELEGEFQSLDEEVGDRLDVFKGKEEVIKLMEDILRSEDSVAVFKELINDVEEKRAKEVKDLNFPEEPPKVTHKIERS